MSLKSTTSGLQEDATRGYQGVGEVLLEFVGGSDCHSHRTKCR